MRPRGGCAGRSLGGGGAVHGGVWIAIEAAVRRPGASNRRSERSARGLAPGKDRTVTPRPDRSRRAGGRSGRGGAGIGRGLARGELFIGRLAGRVRQHTTTVPSPISARLPTSPSRQIGPPPQRSGQGPRGGTMSSTVLQQRLRRAQD